MGQDSLNLPFASYSFDAGSTENVIDSLYNGKAYNVIDTTDRFGRLNSAVYLSGKSYISLGNNFPHFNDKKPYSISLWFKTKKSGALLTRYNQVSKYTREIEAEFVTCVNRCKVEFERHTPPFIVRKKNTIRIKELKRTFQKNRLKKIQSKKRVRNNRWHQMVVTFDGKLGYLYIDGKLQRKAWYMMGSGYTTTSVIIGNGFCYGEINVEGSREVDKRNNVKYNYRAFKGFIDDVNFYNKAIPQEMVQEEYYEYKLHKKKTCKFFGKK